MSVYLSSYTRVLKSYDRDLFAARNSSGVACVFRKVKRFEPVVEDDGYRLLNLREDKQFIFSITDNWNLTGRPMDWGIDDVLGRIKEIDSLANQRFLEDMDAHNEKVQESKKRAMRNEMEAFWSHERRRFAKATNDILTHSLSKDEPNKRLKDKRMKKWEL